MNKIYLLFLPLFFITPVFAEELTWSTMSVPGEYRHWEIPKESDIFKLQYAIINGTITNVETVPTLTIFEINATNNGTIYLNIPKNYPFTNYPDEGRERDALYVKIDEKRINTDDVDIQYDDCYYNYSIPFLKNNSKIEIGFSKTLGSNPYVIEDVPLTCGDFSLKQQIENNMSVDEIECRNNNHVLVLRSNDELACVYPQSAEKLNWEIVTNIVLNSNKVQEMK